MASENLGRDQNHVTVLGAITDNAAQEVRMIRVDPVTNRVLVSATGADIIPDYGYYVYSLNNNNGTYVAVNPITGFSSSSISLDTVWNAIITANGTNPLLIDIGAGTFTTNTGLYFTQSNIKIKGQGKGVTTIQASTNATFDSKYFFGCSPTQTGTKYALTVDAINGDLTLTMSSANLIASGIVAGSYILLSSLLSIDTEFTGRFQGELHKVLSVNTGIGVITLGQSGVGGTHVYQTMTVANTATICLLTFYEDVSIEGITFTDTATSRPSTLGTGQCLFRFIDDLTIRDCEFYKMFDSGIEITQDMNTKIDSCHFRNIQDVTPSSNTYYGIQLRGAAINISISNSTFDNMRHGVTQGAGSSTYLYGTTRNISVSGCTFMSTTTAHMDCHQGAEGVSFTGNTMIGDDGSANGIQSRSPITITANNITGVLGNGISLFGNAHASVISGNVIKGATTGIQISNGTKKPLIIGNIINAGTKGISLNRSTAAVTISIASPSIISFTSHAITPGTRVTFSTTGGLPTGITTGTVYYVITAGITKDSFEISLTLEGSPVNTSGSQSGVQTLAYYSGDDAVIIGNDITDNTSTGMTANGQINVKLSDNTFRNNTTPFIITDTDSVVSNWVITDNFSHDNTSTDIPTIVGSNMIIRNNIGFGAEQPGGYVSFTSGPQTLTVANRVVECTSGTFTVNLPTVINNKSREYTIKNTGTGTITIDANSSETIDGQLTYILNAKDSIVIIADGSANWIIAPLLFKNRNQLRITGAGLISENYPVGAESGTGLMVTQTVYYSLIGLFKGDIVTNINVVVSSAGTTSTSTFVAILDSSGNRLAVSNDLTTALDSQGMKSLALSGAYTVLADGAYYVAILTVSGSPATLVRGTSTASAMLGIGSGAREWANQTGQSTIPTTATFAGGTFAYWMGVS